MRLEGRNGGAVASPPSPQTPLPTPFKGTFKGTRKVRPSAPTSSFKANPLKGLGEGFWGGGKGPPALSPLPQLL
jgi:hypothetical protein